MNPKLLHDAEVKFKEAGIETARLDARVLWEHDPAAFEQSVARRLQHEPIAYITGVKEFWSIPIKVTPAVLIPRPETETVVEEVLRHISRGGSRTAPTKNTSKILDLCTGSGCIVAALATELPHATFVATDISREALDVAKENLGFARDRVTLLQGNLFEPITNQFDIITANPPYIPDNQWPMLAPDITQYEPKQALMAGPRGLDFITRIIEDAPHFLNRGGWLVMEIGDGQASETMEIAKRVGKYGAITLTKDLAGIERVIALHHG
ncbi:MAG: peptide chain release factor N(5)-glutamine methyltransferase [Deltaproteobacteria bacterium]|nr:peptide chain release factor N(5)-glutamine methyltransferase [Deltaproteobacteria bacterium]